MHLDKTGLAIGVAAAITMALLVGCKKEGGAMAALEKTTEAKHGAGDADLAIGEETKGDDFDIAKIPLSSATLGDFPYISLPQGYVSNGEPETKQIARFPFWVQGRAHWVEGRFYLVNVYPEKEGGYNPYELRRNLDALVAQMGG